MKSKKTIKKGGVDGQIFGNILIQENIKVSAATDLYTTITGILESNKGTTLSDIKDDEGNSVTNVTKMINFLDTLSMPNEIKAIFNDIAYIVINYNEEDKRKEINFQSYIFNKKDIFGKYELWNKENQRKFITIDPTIVQIMIFDDQDINDIVYSLKLIIREPGLLSLRYTTQLFPSNCFFQVV